MKKVSTIVIALTMLSLFALMSSCSETLLPTENTPVSTRTSLSKIILDGVTACGETKDVDLWAGQTIDAGDAPIYNDGDNLYVTVYSENGFQDGEEQIKMWIGADMTFTSRPNAGSLP